MMLFFIVIILLELIFSIFIISKLLTTPVQNKNNREELKYNPYSYPVPHYGTFILFIIYFYVFYFQHSGSLLYFEAIFQSLGAAVGSIALSWIIPILLNLNSKRKNKEEGLNKQSITVAWISSALFVLCSLIR